MKRFFSVLIALFFATLRVSALDVARVVPVSAVTATGGSQELDVTGYAGFSEVTFQSLNTAGTNPTLACKVQGSSAAVLGTASITAGATDNKLRAGATTTVKLSAKWTQSGAASIKTATLTLLKLGTITTGGTVTLDVYTDNAGVPSSTSIGTSVAVQTDAIAAAYAPVTFTFTAPVDVADATVYHFVLSGSYSVSASNCIEWRSLTVGSGGTQSTFDNTNWSAVTTQTPEVYAMQYAFSDISGATYTGATTGASALGRVKVYAASVPSFIRFYYTIGGTSNPAYYVSGVYVGSKYN